MSLLRRIESARPASELGVAPARRGCSSAPAAPAAGSPPAEAPKTSARCGTSARQQPPSGGSGLRRAACSPRCRCASRSATPSSASSSASSRTSIRSSTSPTRSRSGARSRRPSAGRSTAEGLALTRAERTRMLEQITDEIIGLGPLEPLLRDESITEVMVNGPRQVYVERSGKIELTDVTFQNDEHVLRIIDRIVAPGRPARRRVVADGRRAPARRLARQRRSSRRSRSVGPCHHDPKVLGDAAARSTT